MRDRTWAIEKAQQLVDKMTIEEQASQLRYDSPAIERLGIPEYNWWNEALHGIANEGVATMFPQAIAMASMFDDKAMETIGHVISEEGRAKYNLARSEGDRGIFKGLTFWSPNINIFRDPRWGRGQETYGEDPYLTSKLGVKFVEGLQGNGKYLRLAACAKHFAVHSGPEKLRHEFNAIASAKDMHETYLPSFEALVKDAEVESVMGAYNRTNGEPCCANRPLMNLLRNEWGFSGYFVSDCWAIRDFHQHHKVTKGPEESVSLALKSGCDINCGCTYTYVMSAFEKGLIQKADITRAAVHLFTTRYLLGMFDHTEFDAIPPNVIESKEHIQLALETTRKGTVLLKNDGLLPLSKKQLQTIAVIGPNANSREALIGNYHGTSSRYITPLEGIQDYCGDDVEILYSEGCHLWKNQVENLARDEDRLSEALSVARRADVVVLCVGMDDTIEGEEGVACESTISGDKMHLHLPGVQEQLVKKVIDVGTPVILLLLAGSPIDLSYAKEKAHAIMVPWYPGARGGKVIADLLFGEQAPSGKLPVTFYQDSDLLPPFTDYSMKGRTYRYVDENNVLYPFGFGLTYGSLHLASASLSPDLLLSAVVVNKKEQTVEEVLQVYVKAEESEYAADHKSLCGFQRIQMAPFSEQKITIQLEKEALLTYDNEGLARKRGNKFSFSVGFSQDDRESIALMGQTPQVITLDLSSTQE